METKITTHVLKDMKARGEKITVLTAYDYPTGKIADESGIDIILVGDSLGEVVLGFDSTLPVTMDMMLHHTAAVARGVERALIVGDMPFMSYQASVDEAVLNAGCFLQEAGAHAVKIEGGTPVIPVVQRLTSIGIPVMGHLGMTPQSEHQLGGRRIQGREEAAAMRIREDAVALQDAGAFAVVLELIPAELASQISQELTIPTIGIGAGPNCDGQVLVTADLLGLYDRFVPKHAKQYLKLWEEIRGAFKSYADEVRAGKFPERNIYGSRNPEMELHEAMKQILLKCENQTAEHVYLTSEINRLNLYRMKDGRPVKSNQIGARAKNYPKLFEKIPADPIKGTKAKIRLR